MKRREQSQTEQLRQALTEREAQLQEAQARLAALEGSTSLQVGRALADAAKRPGRGLVRLPRDLFRLWRGSGRTRQMTGRRRARPVRSYDAERQEARLLTGTVGLRDDRPVVAGVLSDGVRTAIDPYVRAVPLRPHDAQVVFESVDVDLVCVSASATAAGTLWAHAGDPAVSDRTRALRWIIEAAQARGVPTILIADAPAPPALATLGFDHVHDGDIGVPLHLFNPVAAEPDRDPVPVHIPSPGPKGPVVSRLVDRISGDLRSRGPQNDGLPAALRTSAGVVADTPGIADRALVCGSRALLLNGHRTGGASSGGPERAGGQRPGDARPAEALHTVPATAAELRSDHVQHRLTRMRTAGALTPEELRLVLRSVFLHDATPVRLAELLGRVGFAPGAGGSALPLKERRTALLARPADDVTSLALADDVLNQLVAPAEVVVPEEAAHLAGVERLRSHGVPLRTVAMAASGTEPAEWAHLAGEAETPWVALWRGPRGAAFLADALCAVECSGADAVGPPADSPGAAAPAAPADADPDAWVPGGQEYVFVNAIEPELARCELIRRGLHPGEWSRHGVRLLALGPGPGVGRAEQPGQVRAASNTG